MSDDSSDLTPADNAAGLCNWLIILTGVTLVAAIITVNGILSAHYPDKAWF